jgi:general secretion pathway protein E
MAEAQEHDSEDFRLGQRLLERGKLDKAGFERVWRLHEQHGQRIETVVISLGLVPERDMAELLAEFLSLPLMQPADYPAEAVFDGGMSTAFLKESRVLPLGEANEGIVLAMADPRDAFARQAVELKFGRPVVPCVAVPSELEAAIEQLVGGGDSSMAEIVETIGGEDAEADADAERLRSLASEAPVIRLVNLIIGRAVEARASDVHIEPFEDRLRVRYRVDGVLKEDEAPPTKLRHAVISRVKIMANLNIAERRLPQDGRIKLVVRGKEIDLRVSTVPTMHGEKVVLRILDKSTGLMGFDDLGFESDSLNGYLEMLRQPNGIVLVTGPTGSGKTTTLYASLLTLNSPEKNIVTVEDPVEYQLFGVNQIQVRPQIGLSFASVLRSVLRQDPDIIMIGEIRDLETAQIAVQASLTGHLVLSTLHTNSAAASVSRLIDMGVEDYLLTSTLSGVVAQRLVRNLCPHCKERYTPQPELARELDLDRLAQGSEIALYRAKGCGECGDTGYFGRSCISEVLRVDEALQSAIMEHADARRIQERAAAGGMRTMYEDGLRKALAGQTSVEEVLRATREQ